MVMKRYPNGASGEFFFMKRAPLPRPAWIRTCAIEHPSAGVIDFPIVQDLASLLWVVNLGCIDLNPWYARCDDVHRPDYLHFDLDPTPGAGFSQVLETAVRVRDALSEMKIPCYAKTTGSRGIHVYVPIRRGPLQKQVWTFAKALAMRLAAEHPELITGEYRVANRPAGACSWITTRMPGAGRWPQSILRGPSRAPRCRRRSPGRRSRTAFASRTSGSIICQSVCARWAIFGSR
jgi:bifunctional non-homologous end joining protein LigD